ncbi:hypothetical protein AB4144_29930, partial [Rhizobiaceae sp. 2RAB30]
LEDGRVYTGPRWALRKERSYAVGNVVLQKIEGIKQSGPLSLLGRVVGTAAGGEAWGDYLAQVGSFGDMALAFRAAQTARRQASSANYDQPRPTPRGAPDPHFESPRSAPAPAREPVPTPDAVAKAPAAASVTAKGATTAPTTIQTAGPAAGASPPVQRSAVGEAAPSAPVGQGSRLSRLNEDIAALEQQLAGAKTAANRAWEEARVPKSKLTRNEPLTSDEQGLVARHDTLMKEREAIQTQLTAKKAERTELVPRFRTPEHREEWRSREIQTGELLSTIVGKDNVFEKPKIARPGSAQLPVEPRE